jgi:hypothetical protein
MLAVAILAQVDAVHNLSILYCRVSERVLFFKKLSLHIYDYSIGRCESGFCTILVLFLLISVTFLFHYTVYILFVQERDIPAEISDDEAHIRYFSPPIVLVDTVGRNRLTV